MAKNIVGGNLKKIRQHLGITQEELALRCGLTQGYINFLENGKRGYTERSLEKIAIALGIQIHKLFEEPPPPGIAVIAETPQPYGKRRLMYDDIRLLLDKLPATVIEHYRLLLKAEIDLRSKE